MKKVAIYILIIALIVATAGGVLIGFSIITGRNPKNTTVVLNGETQKEISVSLTDFYPGAEQSYKIVLQEKEAKPYDVEIYFVGTGADGLAPFIDVQLCLGDTLLGQGKLTHYLRGEKIAFVYSFAEKTSMDLSVTYSMDEGVGDEAQNQEAKFDIRIAAKPKN